MSRVEKEIEKYMAAFGVDHATGTFVQIWEQPHDDQDAPLVRIDNMGIWTPLDYEEKLSESVQDFLNDIHQRYIYSKRHGNPRPNIDAGTVGRLLVMLGFDPEIEREVYRTFD